MNVQRQKSSVFKSMLLLLLVRPVQGESVASEVNDILAEVKLLVDVPHCCGFGVYTLESLGIVLIKVGYED